MSLVNAAKYLESKGRNGDSMLVHMSPGEVKSLQGLALAAGGSLSINPDTGLVEASFLKRILPLVAGAGLAMIPGVGPLAAAGMVGGFETLRTGDLGRGLMAGLGAYGGAGLASGLSTAGAQSLGTTGAQMTPTATENVGANILKEGVGLGGTTSIPTTNVAAETLRSTAPAPVTFQNMGAGLKSLGSEAGRSAVYGALPTGTVPALGLTAANAMTPGPAPMPGIPGPDEYDKQARVRLGSGFTGFVPQRPNPYYTPTGLGYAAGGDVKKETTPQERLQSALNTAMEGMAARNANTEPGFQFANPEFAGIYKAVMQEVFPALAPPTAIAAAANIAPPGYVLDRTTGQLIPSGIYGASGMGYAEGGDIMLARGGDFDDQPGETAFMAAGGHLPRSSGADVGTYRDTDQDTASLSALDAAKKRLEKLGKASNVKMAGLPKTNVGRLGAVEMASGGLGGYSDGGRMLKGPGDGMSDSIPGVIGGRQPARLADGEFVVPADVVSHLGNGSTDAGARKLYGMMDKIRKARTGKKKQAPEVKAEKYMPKA